MRHLRHHCFLFTSRTPGSTVRTCATPACALFVFAVFVFAVATGTPARAANPAAATAAAAQTDTSAQAASPPPTTATPSLPQTGKTTHSAYTQADNLSYLSPEALATADAYRAAQCRLDIRVPQGVTGFPTVIWLHGGGLTAGTRSFPALENEGWGLVAVSYRLSPQAELPAFIEDAAAATAWVLRNIEAYGGDPQKVFIAGHSAGAYLALMVAMDPRWLAAEGASNQDLAGAIPVSAQATTHFHVKKLQGDTGHPLRPLIDAYAPLYHAAKDLPPICLITGDRAIEWESRVEENLLLEATLRNLKHPHVQMHELAGKDHGTVLGSCWQPMADFIKTVLAARENE